MFKILTGKKGERKAAEYLTKKGYRIKECNMRAPFGEVDIIASDGTVLVFVEVKTRSHSQFGTGADAVTKDKQRKLIKSAQYYCKIKNIMPLCRFDVISIDAGVITHIENAFTA
ncbi:MAG: YraN family protein [Deferribacteraceae bacterium]|nr:YraN family protein [Deferribacteraceae bacterium]